MYIHGWNDKILKCITGVKSTICANSIRANFDLNFQLGSFILTYNLYMAICNT